MEHHDLHPNNFISPIEDDETFVIDDSLTALGMAVASKQVEVSRWKNRYQQMARAHQALIEKIISLGLHIEVFPDQSGPSESQPEEEEDVSATP